MKDFSFVLIKTRTFSTSQKFTEDKKSNSSYQFMVPLMAVRFLILCEARRTGTHCHMLSGWDMATASQLSPELNNWIAF